MFVLVVTSCGFFCVCLNYCQHRQSQSPYNIFYLAVAVVQLKSGVND